MSHNHNNAIDCGEDAATKRYWDALADAKAIGVHVRGFGETPPYRIAGTLAWVRQLTQCLQRNPHHQTIIRRRKGSNP